MGTDINQILQPCVGEMFYIDGPPQPLLKLNLFIKLESS